MSIIKNGKTITSSRNSRNDNNGEIQARLAAIVNSSLDAIIGTDLSLKVISWNKAAQKLYGYKPKEILGKPVGILIPPNRKDEQELLMKAVRFGTARNFQTQRITKKGKLVDVSLTVSPIKIRGKTIGFSTIVRDITKQKELEEKLKLFSEAVEEAPDGIQLVDLKGKIFYSNSAIRNIYGYTPKELQGKDVNVMNAEPTFAHKVIIPSIKKRGHWAGELSVKHKNGKIFPIWLTTSMVKDKNGNPIAMMGLIRDLTQRKRLEELKTEFLSTATHELKTPITTLRLITERHLKKFKEREAKPIKLSELELIDKELERLTGLVNDILDEQRIATGKMNLSFKTVDLNRIVKEVIAKMRILSQNHPLLFTQINTVKVSVDPNRIEQVLINFISNAIKYSPVQTPIQIKVKKIKGLALISVSDKGIGIPKNKQRIIFDRFYQVKEHPTTGFGLGLFISKEIVKRHKGKIWVESQVGKGSTFYFTLPIKQ